MLQGHLQSHVSISRSQDHCLALLKSELSLKFCKAVWKFYLENRGSLSIIAGGTEQLFNNW